MDKEKLEKIRANGIQAQKLLLSALTWLHRDDGIVLEFMRKALVNLFEIVSIVAEELNKESK